MNRMQSDKNVIEYSMEYGEHFRKLLIVDCARCSKTHAASKVLSTIRFYLLADRNLQTTLNISPNSLSSHIHIRNIYL